jgi:hypothetical protein
VGITRIILEHTTANANAKHAKGQQFNPNRAQGNLTGADRSKEDSLLPLIGTVLAHKKR